MEIRFRIAFEVPDKEPDKANVRKLCVSLAVELIRAAAQIDGHPQADRTMSAVADVLAEIALTHKL